MRKLEETKAPLARLVAQYHGISDADGSKIDSDMWGGLEHILCLSVGCRVIYVVCVDD